MSMVRIIGVDHLLKGDLEIMRNKLRTRLVMTMALASFVLTLCLVGIRPRSTKDTVYTGFLPSGEEFARNRFREIKPHETCINGTNFHGFVACFVKVF